MNRSSGLTPTVDMVSTTMNITMLPTRPPTLRPLLLTLVRPPLTKLQLKLTTQPKDDFHCNPNETIPIRKGPSLVGASYLPQANIPTF